MTNEDKRRIAANEAAKKQREYQAAIRYLTMGKNR